MFLPNVGYIPSHPRRHQEPSGVHAPLLLLRHYWEYGADLPPCHSLPRVIPEAPTKNPDKSESGLQIPAVGHSQARSRLPAGCNQRRILAAAKASANPSAIAHYPFPNPPSLLLQLSCPAVLADATAKSIKHSVSGRGIKTAAETAS